ncbi:MAG: hypothetical protein IMY67_11325 [Bacteroidetes bacterium]|nr:hypothetical protein [Bacteroidota bacterium]
MAKNQDIFFTKDGKVSSAVVVPGVPVTIFTAGVDGAKLLMVSVAAFTGVNTVLELLINTGGGDETLGRYTAAVAEGDDIFGLTMPSLPKDKNANQYLNLPGGAIIKADLTGGTNVTLAVSAEDY